MCRFFSAWVDASPADFTNENTHSLLSDILKDIETLLNGNESKDFERKFARECEGKLARLLSAPPMKPSMSQISFYREMKDSSALSDIYGKVMHIQMVSIVANHLLEWCLQVFDKVR